MAETADARRARLLALRAEAGKVNEGGAEGPTRADDHGEETKTLRFRNYTYTQPKEGEGIEHERAAVASAPDLAAELGEPVEAAGSLGNGDAIDGKNMANMATKANADLKRDVAPKLAILERRTQAALVEVRGRV